MMGISGRTYPLPQDKYGLLARWRERKVPGLLERLEWVLREYKAKTILDCSIANGLYVSELEANGWQVASINSAQSSQRYDAVICMENEFIYYKSQKDFSHALQQMLEMLNDDGIAVFCLPDFEGQYGDRDKKFFPLLLEEEVEGKKGSLIQYICMNDHRLLGTTDFIYKLEDKTTHTLMVDWEMAMYEPIYTDMVHNAIKNAGGTLFDDYAVEWDRIFVYGKHGHEHYPISKYKEPLKCIV